MASSHVSEGVTLSQFLQFFTAKPFLPLTLLTLGTVLLVFAYYYKIYASKIGRKMSIFQGSIRLPLIGDGWHYLVVPKHQIQTTISAYIKKYGKVCRFWLGPEPRVLIAEAIAAEKIMSSPLHVERGMEMLDALAPLGKGLLTSHPEMWRRDRKVLNPAFSRQSFENVFQLCDQKSRVLVGQLLLTRGETRNFLPNLLSHSLAIVAESILGIDDENENGFPSAAGEQMLEIMQTRLLKPWLYKVPFLWRLSGYERLEREVKEMCFPILKNFLRKPDRMDRNDNEDSSSTRQTTCVQQLLGCKEIADSEEYCLDHLLTLIFAGTDTTASSINYTLFYLALNPEIQKRCHEEVDLLNESEFSISSVQPELKYVEMCWKESMRLRPPAGGWMRKVLKDVELDDGRIIPVGCDAIFLLYDLHRDASVFEDPLTFNPLRFDGTSSQKRSSYAYMPFGAGFRNCIGSKYATIEVKVALFHILRTFFVTTPQTDEEVKYIPGIISMSDPPVTLCFVPRTKKE